MNKIGNVTINLDYYNGHSVYSDGSIEDEILGIAEQEIDLEDVISKDDRWPILYHFSPVRRQIVEWIDFPENSKLLEIGAGCGAITGVLCEKASEVVAVELSLRRAKIIANRYKHHRNLEIMVGNLNDVSFETSFDIVTLIGVLEYAGRFTEEENPYHSFLRKIAGLMEDNGQLIIAIENKFGLKYWAGAREDHTGRFFDGLENYPHQDGVATFSKDEITKLLLDTGFMDIEFYYPMPDYKMPNQIFSDTYLPRSGQIKGEFPAYDADRLRMFNENLVLENLIKNNKFDFFANSFLILCKKKEVGHS
ncbi:methyltransferase [Paenibacillus oenotherae]|uniref:Methyltransferase n=1 Tax=Paenibacillus oenotherae TaxID=1435645 RepID=A0ABS7D563_9BACL|nr:methyltransferase domain-containing protein [Paenibacillus oenotherae]MBW7475064.1 methyltransferase [Paenibacillus oenotherae]